MGGTCREPGEQCVALACSLLSDNLDVWPTLTGDGDSIVDRAPVHEHDLIHPGRQ
jgi:hypothetical protein